MSQPATTEHLEVRHLVVGAGFAGLCAAIKLQEDGETDFLVVEKGEDVGGTWRDNTYPGAACDVPSQLYSFSFAPNPDWSMSFSPQPEIQAYIQRVAERSGVLDRFRFRTALTSAAWDEESRTWRSELVGETGRTTVSSASRSIESSSSERVASSRTPRSSSWERRWSGLSRVRAPASRKSCLLPK